MTPISNLQTQLDQKTALLSRITHTIEQYDPALLNKPRYLDNRSYVVKRTIDLYYTCMAARHSETVDILCRQIKPLTADIAQLKTQIEQLKKPLPHTQPAAPPVIELSPEEHFGHLFSSTLQVPVEAKSQFLPFSSYLYNHIFLKPTSVNFNDATGAFTVTFNEERQIPFKQTPPALNLLNNSTLVIGKTVKGTLDSTSGTITLDPGSISIKRWLATATLKQISAKGDNLQLTGQALGQSAAYLVPAQAFVNTIESNLQ